MVSTSNKTHTYVRELAHQHSEQEQVPVHTCNAVITGSAAVHTVKRVSQHFHAGAHAEYMHLVFHSGGRGASLLLEHS